MNQSMNGLKYPIIGVNNNTEKCSLISNYHGIDNIQYIFQNSKSNTVIIIHCFNAIINKLRIYMVNKY